MDRGAWRAVVHWVMKSQSDMTEATEHACMNQKQNQVQREQSGDAQGVGG